MNVFHAQDATSIGFLKHTHKNASGHSHGRPELALTWIAVNDWKYFSKNKGIINVGAHCLEASITICFNASI